jgi:GNAT superfamily N-acetyltransferase
MTAGPEIRFAVATDVDQLVELIDELDAHLYNVNPTLWKVPPRTAEPLAGLVERGVVAVAALADGTLAGMVGGEISARAAEPRIVGTIAHAYVRDRWRRAGLGRRLVARVLEKLEALGVADITLRYAIGNHEAEGFWHALGFAPLMIHANASPATVRGRLG